MAHSPPSKIVLKSTTKMSLNDRFSAYREHVESTVGVLRQRTHQETQQNSKNWRLIQQMENRPSVIAALKLKKRSLSLKQRLGQVPRTSIKARLSLGVVGRGKLQRIRGARGRSFPRGVRNRGGQRNTVGISPLQRSGAVRGSLWSLNSGPQLQGRSRVTRDLTQQQWKSRRGGGNILGNSTSTRGRLIRNQGRGREYRRGRNNTGFLQGRGGFRTQDQFLSSSYQGQRGGRPTRLNVNRNRFRGRRGRGRNTQPVPSKQTLDNELDEYMSRTKGNLDMELESYMAQAQVD